MLRCLAIAAIALAAAPARADDTVLVVTGNPHARQVALDALIGASDLAGTRLLRSPFSARDEVAIQRCLAGNRPVACLTPLLKAKRVEHLTVLSLQSPPTADVTVLEMTEQVVIAGQVAPTGDRRYCEHGTDDVLARLAVELTRDLARELAARGGRTVVAIRSVPRGAEITFDGKLLGATDRSIATYPGAHSLQLRLDGYVEVSRSVQADANETTDVQVQLTRAAAPPPPPIPPTPRPQAHDGGGLAAWPRWVPWAGAGVGAAALGAGIVLQVTKDPPPVGEPQPAHVISAPGVALMIAGGAILGASAALWIYLRREPHAAPVVSAAPGGAVVGWSGRF